MLDSPRPVDGDPAILNIANTNGSAPRSDQIGFGEERRGTIRYWNAIRQHWLLIAVLVIVAVAAAAAYSLTAEKQYDAEAALLITPVPAPDNAFLTIGAFRESSDDPTRTVLTLARIIKTPAAAEAAKVAEDLDLTVGELLGAVDVTPVSQSNLITISATASDPDTAAAIANGFAQGIVDVRTEQFQSEVQATIDRLELRLDAIPASERNSAQAVALQQSIAGLETFIDTSDPTVQIASPATPPAGASWPRPKLSVAVAFLAALMVGIAIALALELISPRVRSEEELLFEQRLPVLTRVPRLSQRTVRDYLARRSTLPPDAWEAYRTLRMNLAAASVGGIPPRTILVTSSAPREGKTLTSVNLAISMARAGLRVILVDGDFRRPMLGPTLGVAPRSGLPSFLREPSSLKSLITPIAEIDGLGLVPASPEHALMIDQLDTARAKQFVSALAGLADVVVIDSAPLTEVADSLPLADAVDAVLVAVRLGYTRRDRLDELRRLLAQHGVAPTGFVVTSRRSERRSSSYYATAEPMAQPQRAARRSSRAREQTT